MNIESIIILGVCLVAIAAVSYYFYTQCKTQQTTIDSLLKKCDELEHRLKPVPLHSELAAVYQRNRQQQVSSAATQHIEEAGGTKGPKSNKFNPYEPCGTSLCELQPIVIPTNEVTLEDIVEEEITNVLRDETKNKTKN